MTHNPTQTPLKRHAILNIALVGHVLLLEFNVVLLASQSRLHVMTAKGHTCGVTCYLLNRVSAVLVCTRNIGHQRDLDGMAEGGLRWHCVLCMNTGDCG